MEDIKNTVLNEEELSDVAGGANAGTLIPYKIVRGDTLSGIAHRYHTTVENLVRINNIANKNKIYAGDIIYVPSR